MSASGLRGQCSVNIKKPAGMVAGGLRVVCGDVGMCVRWLRGLDLNQRPSGYEPDELPGCSTPRQTRGRRTVCASVVSVLCEGM
ncbi:protein of unknown function [Methylorubrum extorquens]|uniref:Uncharacterized protein n=1 Tax=Methylorubrum extorquens TaxID=408 RepID=A0A2N9AYC6_METEX|nr:protein of unknown function [Methylorubrum extorquens]